MLSLIVHNLCVLRTFNFQTHVMYFVHVFLNSFLPSCLATCRCVGARIVKEVLQFIFESGFPHDINAIMEHNFFQEVDLQQPPHYEDVVSSLSTVM